MTNSTTNNNNNDVKFLNTEELAATILKECKAAAKRAGHKYGFSKMADLEGFLITDIWEYLSKREAEFFHNVMMIRKLIKQRTINHIKRDLMPLNNTINFAMMWNGETFDGETKDAFEDTIPDSSDMELSNSLKDFRASLSDKQRQILDLHTAGYGNNEIVEMVGCSINTPKNTMKKIKELAVQFGL